jgi:hypothetical protein
MSQPVAEQLYQLTAPKYHEANKPAVMTQISSWTSSFHSRYSKRLQIHFILDERTLRAVNTEREVGQYWRKAVIGIATAVPTSGS